MLGEQLFDAFENQLDDWVSRETSGCRLAISAAIKAGELWLKAIGEQYS